MGWLLGLLFLVVVVWLGTKFPIKDDVMMFCSQCNAYVWCARTVYPDVVYYTCKRRKHHFSHKPSSHIEGDKQVPPPTGYGEDDK